MAAKASLTWIDFCGEEAAEIGIDRANGIFLSIEICGKSGINVLPRAYRIDNNRSTRNNLWSASQRCPFPALPQSSNIDFPNFLGNKLGNSPNTKSCRMRLCLLPAGSRVSLQAWLTGLQSWLADWLSCRVGCTSSLIDYPSCLANSYQTLKRGTDGLTDK